MTIHRVGSCTVQIERFVNKWFWREAWLKCKASPWRGPFDSEEAATHAAGIKTGEI